MSVSGTINDNLEESRIGSVSQVSGFSITR